MSHRRISKRKAVLAGAGLIAVGTAAVLLPNANASQNGQDDPDPRTMSSTAASGLASQLAAKLGPAFGGAYYDTAKQQMTVNVAGSDDQAMDMVRKAGAVARGVQNSTTKLTSAAHTLRQQATIAGTAWSVDPKTNQIRVTADSTVTGQRWDRLQSTVTGLGDGVASIKKSSGEFKPFAAGGDAIFGGGARCSLGFNVTTEDGSPGFITAGHCGVAADAWSDAQDGQPVATVQTATFPGDGDFSLLTYDDPATEAPSEVNVGGGQSVQITQAAEAAVGQDVVRMGSTTGLNDGTVTGLDATVNYAEGTVTGLIQTDVCAEPGDSGGPLFTEDGSAIGLTSGGSGDCTAGGETFFQPVTTALAAVGAQIGTGDQGGDGGAAAAGGAAADGGGAAAAGGDDGANGGDAGAGGATGDQGAGGAAAAGGDQATGGTNAGQDAGGTEDAMGRHQGGVSSRHGH